MDDLGATVDELRQLHTDLGLRPYRVVSVLQRWSGRRIGAGVVQVVRELELLPTPLLDLTPVRRRNTEGGYTEDGVVTLRQISPRLTEEQVVQLCCPQGLGPGEESFIEVRHDARDGETPRRRFTVESAPYRKAGAFEWTVRLRKANPDRAPDGAPSGERDPFPNRIRNFLMDEE